MPTCPADTWWRMVCALAAAEASDEGPARRLRVMDALASRRLFSDQRLLAEAGTGGAERHHGMLHVVPNSACFVFVSPGGPPQNAAIDIAALTDCAALWLWGLDGARRDRQLSGDLAVGAACTPPSSTRRR